MSIIYPTKCEAFKVNEGSLEAEWVEYMNGFGKLQRLFKVNPQTSKVVSLNKEGLILPDTGYSFMESITVTNTAPTGKNEILIMPASSMSAPFIMTGVDKYYSHTFLPVRDGKIDWDFQNGREYINALYPTDVFKCHPASWAVGRQWDDSPQTVTSASDRYYFERNDRGRVIYFPSEALGYKVEKSFSA
jgi:hypothetical protein